MSDIKYSLGVNYYYKNEPILARKELSEAIKMNPSHHDAYYMLGIIAMGRREFHDAIEFFNRSIKLKVKDSGGGYNTVPEVYNNLGTVYLQLKLFDKAIAYFKLALQNKDYLSPYLAENNLGWAYFEQKKYKLAQSHFESAIFLNPKFCLGYNNLGLLFTSLNEKNKAIDYFERAIEKCNTYVEPHYRLGILYKQTHRSEKAKKYFSRCLQLDKSGFFGKLCQPFVDLN